MALTPYEQQRSILAANYEVAERQAVLFGQAACNNYAIAKKEYDLGHSRFSSRVPAPAAPNPDTIITAEKMVGDISYYTSCPDPNLEPYPSGEEGEGFVSTRDIDKELKDRARVRQQEDESRMTRKKAAKIFSGTTGGNGENLVEKLQELMDLAYEDIVAVEKTHFRKLAKTYYDTFYGPFEEVLTTEREGRRTMEDIQLSVALGTLSAMRDRIHLSEELLMLRAMGAYPLQLLRNNKARQLQEEQEAAEREAAAKILDDRLAVPLWQRVLAIRNETEAEEEMAFRMLYLANVTEADFVSRGLARHNLTRGGAFQFTQPEGVPHYFDESVRYVYTAERLFCELAEETQRMAIIDEAMDGFDEINILVAQPPEVVEEEAAE